MFFSRLLESNTQASSDWREAVSIPVSATKSSTTFGTLHCHALPRPNSLKIPRPAHSSTPADASFLGHNRNIRGPLDWRPREGPRSAWPSAPPPKPWTAPISTFTKWSRTRNSVSWKIAAAGGGLVSGIRAHQAQNRPFGRHLSASGFDAARIHGDRTQGQRNQALVINGFWWQPMWLLAAFTSMTSLTW